MPYENRPDYPLSQGHLEAGFDVLVRRIEDSGSPVWLIDGTIGVDWPVFIQGLESALSDSEVYALDVSSAQLPAADIQQMFADWLEGGVFGKVYPGALRDFCLPDELAALEKRARATRQAGKLVVIYGQGSGLLSIDAAYAWVDLPMETIRNRVGQRPDLLLTTPPYPASKSLPCVDWQVIKRHRATLLTTLDIYIDGSHPTTPVVVTGQDLRATMSTLARHPFRVKPVFSSRIWGGQWLKEHVPLPHMPNCAWSLQLVAPENSILLRDRELHLEVPFEVLMAHAADDLLGSRLAPIYSDDFPLRFNLSDTIGGGHLSCQVHPGPDDALEQLGHRFIENESYYILRSEEGGSIFLGLKEDADADAFRLKAEKARDAQIPFDTADFVEAWPAQDHSLFHIPAGTVHNIGANCLVLEIITSSWVHTYRIYDYLRRDDRGKARDVHIEQAWDTADFSRRKSWVQDNLLPGTRVANQGKGWLERQFEGPAFLHHTISQIEFDETYQDDTRGEHFHLLMLVEGESVQVEWESGKHDLNYAETIVIPAATGRYVLRNRATKDCKIVKAFIAQP